MMAAAAIESTNETADVNNDIDEVMATAAKSSSVIDEWLVEAPLQTSTPLLARTTSIGSSSSNSSTVMSVSQIVRRVTNADGSLDYDRLKTLLHADHNHYRERLKREKSKRILLEELIVKFGEENRSNSSSVSTIKSSTSFRCPSAGAAADDDDDDESASTLSSVDSNDLLAELVRLRLAKTKKRKKKVPDNNCAPSNVDAGRRQQPSTRRATDEKLSANKENFYQSTSLFGYPTTPLRANRLSASENGRALLNAAEQLSRRRLNDNDKEMQQPNARHHQMRKAYPTEFSGRSSTRWWWVNSDGAAVDVMPPTLKDSLAEKRHDFVARCAARQTCIREASELREQLQNYRRKVAESVASRKLTIDDANQLLVGFSLSNICAFPRKQMISETRRKVKLLPEYVAKQLNNRRQLEKATNRIAAQIYKQRLSSQLLSKKSITTQL